MEYLYTEHNVKYLFEVGFSIGKKGVDVPFSMHIDMADYMGVTQEGKDGHVTVHVKGGPNINSELFSPLNDFQTVIHALVVPGDSDPQSQISLGLFTNATSYSFEKLNNKEDFIVGGLYGDFLGLHIDLDGGLARQGKLEWPSGLPTPPGYANPEIDILGAGVTTSFEMSREDVIKAFNFDDSDLVYRDITKKLGELADVFGTIGEEFRFRTASDAPAAPIEFPPQKDGDGYLLPYYGEIEQDPGNATNDTKEAAEDIWRDKVLNYNESIAVQHSFYNNQNDSIDWFKVNTTSAGNLEVLSEYIPATLDKPDESPQWARGRDPQLDGDLKVYHVSGGTTYFHVKASDLNGVALEKTFGPGKIETSVRFYPENESEEVVGSGPRPPPSVPPDEIAVPLPPPPPSASAIDSSSLAEADDMLIA